MERTYEITPTPQGWRMAVYEDGIEIAGGAGDNSDDDYAYLLEQAEAICAVN